MIVLVRVKVGSLEPSSLAKISSRMKTHASMAQNVASTIRRYAGDSGLRTLNLLHGPH